MTPSPEGRDQAQRVGREAWGCPRILCWGHCRGSLLGAPSPATSVLPLSLRLGTLGSAPGSLSRILLGALAIWTLRSLPVPAVLACCFIFTSQQPPCAWAMGVFEPSRPKCCPHNPGCGLPKQAAWPWTPHALARGRRSANHTGEVADGGNDSVGQWSLALRLLPAQTPLG